MKRKIFSLVLTLVIISLYAVSINVNAETYTPVAKSNWNGHTYHLYDVSMTWEDAKAYCENIGGHLATVTSDDEQSFIESINAKNSRLWIGGYRDDNYNWYWVTGEKWEYTNWDKGEPNDSRNVIGNENRVAVWPKYWNDLNENNLNEQSGFICEWDENIDKVDGGQTAEDIATSEEDSDENILNRLIFRNGGPIAAMNKEFEDYVFAKPSMSEEYDVDLAFYLCALSFSTYDKGDIEKSLYNIGFTNVYTPKDEYEVSPEHKAAFALAKKKMLDGRTLVFISVKGSQDGGDWRTNLGLGFWTTLVNGKHEGFMISVNNIIDNLKTFLNRTNLASDDITYVITGHSLGAGVANLLAVELSDDEISVDKNNVYCYTFATPDVAKKWYLDFNNNGIHNNIKNLCNIADVVPHMPGEAGNAVNTVVNQWASAFRWGKFGITKWIAVDSGDLNYNHMEGVYLKSLSNGIYLHSIPYDFANIPDRKIIVVKCPVDVKVYEGEILVASVIDGEGQIYGTEPGEILIFTNEDEKYICVPKEKEYSVRLTATDTGTMTYTVEMIDTEKNDVSDRVVWNTVALVKGKEFTSNISNQTSVSDTDLYEVVTENNGSISKVKIPMGVHFRKSMTYSNGQFKDIPEDAWYANSVAEAYELGLMIGDSETSFNPLGDVTIAEAITIASRIHSIYLKGAESIEQSSGEWYQPYLDYALKNEIINRSYYDMDVTQKATRAQFAEIFAKAMPGEAFSRLNAIEDDTIPDVKTADSFAAPIYKLYRSGILCGNDEYGTFYPYSSVVRAEVAAIASRMAESNNRVEKTFKKSE